MAIAPKRWSRTVMWRRTLAGLLAAVSCFFPTPAAWAGAPMDQVRRSIEQAIEILGDPRLRQPGMAQERRARIRQQADEIFDLQETAKRALGRQWQQLDQDQQKQFVALFTGLLERSYLTKIDKYSGEKISYVGDSLDGDLATVKTTFTTKAGQDMSVDYRLHRRNGRWLVYDVFIEGVSLVANYRTQFDRILRTSSYQELVRRIRASGERFSSGEGS
jgi:phospholipid transport system substrate-binding protein